MLWAADRSDVGGRSVILLLLDSFAADVTLLDSASEVVESAGLLLDRLLVTEVLSLDAIFEMAKVVVWSVSNR